MKAVKFIGKFLLWTLGVIVALVLALPLWIGPVVKSAANAVVPSKTGTGFNLGEFSLNQYVGRLTVGDMQLENPAGCSQRMAATLGNLHVDVDMGTVLSDTIVVEDVVLKDVFVSYVSDDKGENNFAVIQRNATGGSKAEGEGEGEGEGEVEGEGETSQTSKKVIIDHLLVEGVLVQIGPISLPLPKIELNGIGRKSDGVTLQEAWNQIYESVAKSCSAIGVNLSDFGNASMDQAVKAVDASKALGEKGMGHAKRAADAANESVKGMSDALKGGAGATADAAGRTVDAVSESTGKAVDAVSDSFKSIKGLFK